MDDGQIQFKTFVILAKYLSSKLAHQSAIESRLFHHVQASTQNFLQRLLAGAGEFA